MTRVLVLADSAVVRAGLVSLLSTNPDLTVVGSTPATVSSTRELETLQPDVILLEVDSTDHPSVSELLALSTDLGLPAIALLVDDSQDSSIPDALRAGVKGVLPSDAIASEIVAAVEAIAAGLVVIHSDLAEALFPALPAGIRAAPVSPSQALTQREIEILRMLAEGLGNKTIARQLTISEHTVKFHVSSIFSKLNASSRTEAVTIGARQGLILL